MAEGAPLLRNYQARGTLFERLLTPFRRIKVALVDWNNPVTVIASPNMSLMTHTYDTLICTLTTNIKAMLRTTTAPTMLSGSVKTNVLPIEAVATVNFRIHPRDSMDSIEAYVSDVVASDTVTVRRRGGSNASAVSDWSASGYGAIAQSMREVYADAVVAPGLMIAASDSRHYGKVADNAYRFNPIRLTPELLTGFHGTNERISIADYAQGVRGYIRIIGQGTSE